MIAYRMYEWLYAYETFLIVIVMDIPSLCV